MNVTEFLAIARRPTSHHPLFLHLKDENLAHTLPPSLQSNLSNWARVSDEMKNIFKISARYWKIILDDLICVLELIAMNDELPLTTN